jgi:hypothetical protein
VLTKSKLGAACCGLAIVVAGCGGGSGRLTARDYARQASELCRRGNRAVARIEVPRLTATADGTRAMARIVVVQRDTIDELRGLRPPEHLAVTVQKWIALLDQGADELELMAVRLRVGRTEEALAFGAKAMTLLDRAREVMAPLRVTSCRGPVLPTV